MIALTSWEQGCMQHCVQNRLLRERKPWKAVNPWIREKYEHKLVKIPKRTHLKCKEKQIFSCRKRIDFDEKNSHPFSLDSRRKSFQMNSLDFSLLKKKIQKFRENEKKIFDFFSQLIFSTFFLFLSFSEAGN